MTMGIARKVQMKTGNAILLIPALLILGAVLGLLWWLLPGLVVWLWEMVMILWLPVLVTIALAVSSLFFYVKDKGFSSVACIALAGIAFIGGAWFMGYQRAEHHASTIKVEQMDEKNSQLPSFAQRQPFQIAEAVSNRTLGDSTGDTTGTLKAIPSKENFTTSVRKRGFLDGYESVQSVKVAPFGTTSNQNVSFCKYDEKAKLRLTDTAVFNSLGREIHHKAGFNVYLDDKDAFAVCEGDNPYLYVPLTSRRGFFATRTFGGVAIYNGKTGELKIEKDYDGPYPVYPASLAQMQRESSSHLGSFWDYLFKRAGFEDTSKDENDPNKPYNADFVLSDARKENSYYVTPLTPRGSSDSIVALGSLEGNKGLHAGQTQGYTIYKYAEGKSHAANSAVSASITGDILAGYKSSGLSVYEVVPAEDGTWTASVGREQTVLYRAKVSREGYITLVDASGKVVGSNEPNAKKPEGDASKTEQSSGKDVSQMSDEEIKALIDKGVEELMKRSAEQK